MKVLPVCCQIGKFYSIMKQDTLGKQVAFKVATEVGVCLSWSKMVERVRIQWSYR